MASKSCLLFCSMLSASGIILLTLFGVILYAQPTYIHGIDPKVKKPHELCFYGAITYVGTLIVSIFFLKYKSPIYNNNTNHDTIMLMEEDFKNKKKFVYNRMISPKPNSIDPTLIMAA